MVPIEETIKGFNAILDGEVDDLPEQAFLNVGTIEDARRRLSSCSQQHRRNLKSTAYVTAKDSIS